MGVRNGGQGTCDGGADDDTQVRHMFCPYWDHMDGGVESSAF